MTAPDAITTLVTDHHGVSVVSVSGEIDLVTAPALEQAIGAVVAERPTALVIDLSAVEFLGSVGLKILAATYEQLGKSTGFGVVALGPATRRPIQLTGLDKTFSAVPDAGRRAERRAGRQLRPVASRAQGGSSRARAVVWSPPPGVRADESGPWCGRRLIRVLAIFSVCRCSAHPNGVLIPPRVSTGKCVNPRSNRIEQEGIPMTTVTDYDARRVSDIESTQDGSRLRELVPTLHGAPATAVDEEPNDLHFFELPGAELSGEELSVAVIPQRADEFTCSSCFLIQHRSRLASTHSGLSICADCS